MKTKKLTEMTNKELFQYDKMAKVVTYTLAGAVFILFVVTIYVAVIKGFGALNVVPIALLPMVFINLNTIKGIKKELNTRNLL
jgi:hypothetical protein